MAEPFHMGHSTFHQPLDPPVVRTTVVKSESRSKGKFVLNGHYVREKQVGRGQHGQVFKAIDIDRNGTPVAIKVVKRNNPRAKRLRELRRQQSVIAPSNHIPLTPKVSSTESKIRREIAIMKKCRHANVVMLVEVIDDPISERIFMVMEYLGGGELKWKTRDKIPKPILRLDQIRRISRDVILGLEYLHFQGIIHRDIKPANLVWNHDRSTVKITDFGVSHFSYAQRLAAVPRINNQPVDVSDPLFLDEVDLAKRAGTPFYLAPEIVDSDWNDSGIHSRYPVTKAIDIWAFGITLYSLLFGGPPFFEDDPQPYAEFRVYKKICNEDWDVPETMGFDAVPTGGRHPKRKSEGYQVITLLEALLEKNPQNRINLVDLKANRWILTGIPEPEQWIRDTTPKDADVVLVTDEDTHSALAPFALGTWGRIQRRFSSMFRRVAGAGRSNRTRQLSDECLVGVNPGPVTKVKRHHSTSSTMVNRDKKGRAKPSTTLSGGERVSSMRQRAKSAERPSTIGHKAGTLGTLAIDLPRKMRRGSESKLLGLTTSPPPSGASSPLSSRPSETVIGTSEANRRWWFMRLGRSSLEASAVSSREGLLEYDPIVREQMNRRSEEALRPRSLQQSDPLTSAKRASSWGAPVLTDAEEDEESIHSDTIGEIEMRIGAGGFADPPLVNSAATVTSNASRALSPDRNAGRYNQVADAVASSSQTDPEGRTHHLQVRRSRLSQLNQVITSDDDGADGEDESGDQCNWTEATDSSGCSDDDLSENDGEDDHRSVEVEADGEYDDDEGQDDSEPREDESAQIMIRTKHPRVEGDEPASPLNPVRE